MQREEKLLEGPLKPTGAIEGTRTPTPLRVHGPEPCASANSATMARGLRSNGGMRPPHQENQPIYFTGASPGVKPRIDPRDRSSRFSLRSLRPFSATSAIKGL